MKDKPKIIELPAQVSRLYLCRDVALISAKPKPNAWRRFWLWAFFGWRWTNIEQPEPEPTPGVRAVSEDEFNKTVGNDNGS